MAIQKFNCLELLGSVNANETTRQQNEITRQNMFNQWAQATAEANVTPYGPSVNVTMMNGHKHFVFGLPVRAEERATIAAGEIDSAPMTKKQFISYSFPLGVEINNTNMGLPADLEKNFLLINLPPVTTEQDNEFISYACPQIIMDGNNIYMRRLGATQTGDGSEANPFVWTYTNKTWKKLGSGV